MLPLYIPEDRAA